MWGKNVCESNPRKSFQLRGCILVSVIILIWFELNWSVFLSVMWVQREFLICHNLFRDVVFFGQNPCATFVFVHKIACFALQNAQLLYSHHSKENRNMLSFLNCFRSLKRLIFFSLIILFYLHSHCRRDKMCSAKNQNYSKGRKGGDPFPCLHQHVVA